MGYSRIVGTGAYLPAKTLTNQELHQIQKNFVKKYRDKIAFHHKLYD